MFKYTKNGILIHYLKKGGFEFTKPSNFVSLSLREQESLNQQMENDK